MGEVVSTCQALGMANVPVGGASSGLTGREPMHAAVAAPASAILITDITGCRDRMRFVLADLAVSIIGIPKTTLTRRQCMFLERLGDPDNTHLAPRSSRYLVRAGSARPPPSGSASVPSAHPALLPIHGQDETRNPEARGCRQETCTTDMRSNPSTRTPRPAVSPPHRSVPEWESRNE